MYPQNLEKIVFYLSYSLLLQPGLMIVEEGIVLTQNSVSKGYYYCPRFTLLLICVFVDTENIVTENSGATSRTSAYKYKLNLEVKIVHY